MLAVATSIDEVIAQLGDVTRIRSRETSGVSKIIEVLNETSTAGV
jgi:hypothetical protein